MNRRVDIEEDGSLTGVKIDYETRPVQQEGE